MRGGSKYSRVVVDSTLRRKGGDTVASIVLRFRFAAFGKVDILAQIPWVRELRLSMKARMLLLGNIVLVAGGYMVDA